MNVSISEEELTDLIDAIDTVEEHMRIICGTEFPETEQLKRVLALRSRFQQLLGNRNAATRMYPYK